MKGTPRLYGRLNGTERKRHREREGKRRENLNSNMKTGISVNKINTIFAWLPQNFTWDRKKGGEALNLFVILRKVFGFPEPFFSFIFPYFINFPYFIITILLISKPVSKLEIHFFLHSLP